MLSRRRCGCARRCSRCCSCRSSRRCCSAAHPGLRSGRSTATPADGWPWVRAARRRSPSSTSPSASLAFGPLLEDDVDQSAQSPTSRAAPADRRPHRLHGHRVLGVALAGLIAGRRCVLGLAVTSGRCRAGRRRPAHLPARAHRAGRPTSPSASPPSASALYLWPRTGRRFWDLARRRRRPRSASVFTGLTLVTGSIWGQPTWGVYWTWDARLTTTALLFVLYLGYLAVRASRPTPTCAARRAAIVGLVAFVDMPIVHYSVDWWRTLHQRPTISTASTPTIDGLMLVHAADRHRASFPAARSRGCWSTASGWPWLEEQVDERGLAEAIAERRAEAAPSAGRGRADGRRGARLPADGTMLGVARGRRYAIGAAVLGGYVAWLLSRGRRLCRQVPRGAAPAGHEPRRRRTAGGLHPRPRPARPRLAGQAPAAPRRRLLVAVVLAPSASWSSGPGQRDAVLLQRRRGGRASGTTLGTDRFRLQGTVVRRHDGRSEATGVDFTIDLQRRRRSPVHHGRPARAVPAGHPGGAGGPLVAATCSPATASSSSTPRLRGREPGPGRDYGGGPRRRHRRPATSQP